MKQKEKTLLRQVFLAVLVLILAGTAILLPRLWNPSPEPTEPPEPTLPPSPYRPSDFAFADGYLSCLVAETVLGIDVSHHQGEIDWAQVKASGVEFVMVRLGNRGYTNGELAVDRNVRQNLEGARAAGLLVGAYFYSQAISVAEAREEAALALQILDGFPLDLPLTFDWEQEARTAGMDARTLTDCTLAFCRDVEAAGYRPMIYFNSYQAEQLLYLQELTDYPWWLAMYDISQEFPCPMDMWQYTCTGSVSGIAGDVDINLWFPGGII